MLGACPFPAASGIPRYPKPPRQFEHLAGGLRRHKIPSIVRQEPTKDRWITREPRKS